MRIKLKQQRLAEIIATSGLTQNHWAIRLGLSRGHWSDIVNGNHPYPSAKTRTRILDAFAVPFEVLFEIEVTADPWVDTDFRRAISDRYIIDNEIGQGGMGAVYLARDIRHGRAVAVKVIAPEAVSGIGMTQFQREVSTVAQLQHPNILPMFEAGDIAGHPFFVMPLVRGGSLRDRLKQETRLSLSDAVALVRGIAEALQFAHGERVLHCDVKPENILLHKRHPWVTDFGIARRLHNEPRELARRQGLDISAGTPAYVSPEQAAGETDLDARSDVYSLGCMVYEMLSGRPPFEGTSTQQVVASRFIAPAPPLRDFAPDVSPDVQAVIQRAMALPREQRPHTATAFADELERAAARKPHLLANASYATWRHINRVQRRLDVLPRHPIGGLVRNFIEDIHYAARLTARNVVVSAAVVATMVLGIAVTTAVFSVVNSVLLKPLPFDGSDRVVRLGITGRSGTFSQLLAYPDIQDYKRNAHMFADITAVLLSGVTLGGGGVPEQLLGAYVDEAYARVFSVQPVAGRFFAADEFSEGSPRVVMISHGLWQRQFGSDTSIVGRTITLDNEPTTVVGVLPPMAYTFPYPGLRFLAPLRPRAGTYQVNRGAQWLRAAGRMRPGVTVEQARADVAGIAAGIAKQFPDANIGLRTRVELLHDVEGEDVRPMLVLLSLAVAAVLIIACVNIANVLLGQSRARAREFAVRAALGGSGGRIQRQLITESMFLATIGGALGIALAPRLTHLLVALYPGRLPRAEEVGVDVGVLVVGAAATVLAGVLAGIPAARRAIAVDLTRDLRGGDRSGSARGQHRIAGALIASQVALSLPLLFSAALLLRTFQALSGTDPGFQTAGVVTFAVDASRARYPAAREVENYFAAVDRALRALPGVVDVATTSELPYNGNSSSDVFLIKERGDQGVNNPQVRTSTVSPGYWKILGVPVLAGRTFGLNDGGDTPRVVVINEALAKRYYGGEDPVGHHIRFNNQDCEIIGVVGSMRMSNVTEPPQPELYAPSTQIPQRVRYLLLKVSAPPPQVITQAQRVLRDIDPTVALTEISTMAELFAAAVAPQRFRATLVSGLGVLALLLSALGIYGVVAHAVSRQTREIGIRMALGEEQGRATQRVILSTVGTAAGGAIAGVGIALALGRWLSRFLVGVEAQDPAMLSASVALLLMVAAAAAYFPARRASHADPLVALRSE